ncbi:hypothetical protein [Komagataeibacter xylinus]|uniref:hypothetical protein n=1 Tax=Komagataeibacter xylinus TaxID=28448 RepID=UPI000A9E8AA4|nr:hypothetical protein [Komagataeibacter xylinus]GBQ70174.1 hypothetical protein AA15237_0805 [Komagataeibacter xylinus NBRC 15237]
MRNRDGQQRAACGTQHERGDNPFLRALIGPEVKAHEFERTGNDTGVETKHKPGKSSRPGKKKGVPASLLHAVPIGQVIMLYSIVIHDEKPFYRYSYNIKRSLLKMVL